MSSHLLDLSVVSSVHTFFAYCVFIFHTPYSYSQLASSFVPDKVNWFQRAAGHFSRGGTKLSSVFSGVWGRGNGKGYLKKTTWTHSFIFNVLPRDTTPHWTSLSLGWHLQMEFGLQAPLVACSVLAHIMLLSISFFGIVHIKSRFWAMVSLYFFLRMTCWNWEAPASF